MLHLKDKLTVEEMFKPPELGCVLYLPGLPGSGSKIYDRSPYGNQGSITGATWKRLPSGLWCLSFDGTDDYVDCGDKAVYDVANLTIEAWIKVEGSATNQQILTNYVYSAPNSYGYRLFTYVNGRLQLELYFGADGYRNIIHGADYRDSTWHQVVATYGEGYLRLFRDGVATVTPIAETRTLAYSAVDLTISAATETLEGQVALVRLYNRALSALEIQNHFNQEKHLFGVWQT